MIALVIERVGVNRRYHEQVEEAERNLSVLIRLHWTLGIVPSPTA